MPTFNAAKLSAACVKLKPVMNDGRVVPILGCVVLAVRNGRATLRGGDGSRELTVPLGDAPISQPMLIPFAALFAFASGGDDSAEIEIAKGADAHIILRSGRRRAKLAVPGDVDEYPAQSDREYPSSVSLPAPELASLFARCLPFVYDGPGRDMIAGVNLTRVGGELRAMATDGVSVIRADGLAQFEGADFGSRTIPADGAAALVALCKDALGDARLGIAESGFLLTVSESAGEAALRLPAIATEFPGERAEALLAGIPNLSAATLPRKAVLAAVSRVSNIARTVDSAVWLQAADGELRVAAKGDTATSDEYMAAMGDVEFCQTAAKTALAIGAFDGEHVTVWPETDQVWRLADPDDQSVAVAISAYRGGQAPGRE